MSTRPLPATGPDPGTPNVLGDDQRPTFFEVANPAEVGISALPARRGEALTTWVRSLSGMQKEALVVSARTGKVWRLASDEGAYLAGHDEAPCPLAFLTAGMIASYMTEILAASAKRGIGVRRLELTQDSYYTMEGSMAKRTMMGGALPVDLAIDIECDLDHAAKRALCAEAVAASPLRGLVRGMHPSRFALTLNGRQLAPRRVAGLDGPIRPDPGSRFELARPLETTLELTGGRGETPAVEGRKLTSAPGSSLADSQSRILRIGGVGKLRADGVKEILQLQYSPRGTRRLLLSEEALPDSPNGGRGRAPDALTLVSAGIGLCFMTQLGRFARMMRKQLDGYRIVQDTRFTLAGDTGRAGPATPVETHLYLDSPEDDTCARDVLDMGERTCFLHALCRTDVTTTIDISP